MHSTHDLAKQQFAFLESCQLPYLLFSALVIIFECSDMWRHIPHMLSRYCFNWSFCVTLAGYEHVDGEHRRATSLEGWKRHKACSLAMCAWISVATRLAYWSKIDSWKAFRAAAAHWRVDFMSQDLHLSDQIHFHSCQIFLWKLRCLDQKQLKRMHTETNGYIMPYAEKPNSMYLIVGTVSMACSGRCGCVLSTWEHSKDRGRWRT